MSNYTLGRLDSANSHLLPRKSGLAVNSIVEHAPLYPTRSFHFICLFFLRWLPFVPAGMWRSFKIIAFLLRCCNINCTYLPRSQCVRFDNRCTDCVLFIYLWLYVRLLPSPACNKFIAIFSLSATLSSRRREELQASSQARRKYSQEHRRPFAISIYRSHAHRA